MNYVEFTPGVATAKVIDAAEGRREGAEESDPEGSREGKGAKEEGAEEKEGAETAEGKEITEGTTEGSEKR